MFLDSIKHKIITSSNIIGPSPKKQVSPSETFSPSEDAEKGSGTLDDIKEQVVMGNTKITKEL